MKIFSSIDAADLSCETAVTIGAFDGVHLGHQYLLAQLAEYAGAIGRCGVAVSFDPHPRAVLSPEESPRILCSTEERVRRIEMMGLDYLLLLPFTLELASTSAEDFAQQLHDLVGMRSLWVGSDFAMGRDRTGSTERLLRLGEIIGFSVKVMPPYKMGGEIVSSTRIRELLAEGAVAHAGDLLGRYYTFTGQVAFGAQRGRRLGFRTANLEVSLEYALPADGVYAVWAEVDGQCHPAVANIGIRPSFDAGERRLEVHLLDYQGDLYGSSMKVAFVERLREERAFDDARALKAQVDVDISQARHVLHGQAKESILDA